MTNESLEALMITFTLVFNDLVIDVRTIPARFDHSPWIEGLRSTPTARSAHLKSSLDRVELINSDEPIGE
jgi:hypothetical protein